MSGKGSICRQNSKKAVNDNGNRSSKGCTKTCDFGRWEFISPVRYLKHVGGKVAAVVVRITARVAAPPICNRNNQPPPPPKTTSVAPVDSQRAEAIHDCINFINSSSSLPRSNSVAR